MSDTTVEEPAKPAGLKAKIAHEFREMVIITVYLLLFFFSFATQKMFLLHQFRQADVIYGAAIIKSLVMAKVILFGQMARLGRRLEHRSLIQSSLFKAFMFALLVAVFDLLEDIVKGLFHGEDLAGIFHKMGASGSYELVIIIVIAFCVFIPFFALMETRRVMGEVEFENLFLRRGK
jgi:magnesium-transporting ATPase (P-type)